MARILVTGVGGPTGSSLARQFRARGHFVLGVDTHDVHAGLAHEVMVLPPASSPEYLQSMCHLAVNSGVDLVVPTVSDELPLLAEGRPMFGSGVEVLIAQRLAVHTANDKYLTMTALQSAGHAVPAFGLPADFASAQDAIDRLGGPVVVKPRVSRGTGALRLENAVQLIENTYDAGTWHELDSSLIVQRFAPGAGYVPAVFRSCPGGDAADVVVVLEKTSAATRRVDPETAGDVAALAIAAVGTLGLTGPADVDMRRMPDGTPVVLGVKARFGVNSAHAPEIVDAVLCKFRGDNI